MIEHREKVKHIVDFRIVYFGPDSILVTSDVTFDPDLVIAEIDEVFTAIEDRLMDPEPDVEKVYIELKYPEGENR